MPVPIYTAAQLADLMARRRQLVEFEFRHSSKALAKSMVKFDKELMTEQIYSLPVPTLKYRLSKPDAQGKRRRIKTNKKAWKRTGHLRRAEKAVLDGPFTIVVFNEAIYAKRRHDLTYPVQDEDALDRTCHWRTDLLRVFRPIVREVRRNTILDILRADGQRTSTRGVP